MASATPDLQLGLHSGAGHCLETGILNYRTVGVAYRLAANSVTCDNAQLSEPCSCWPAAAGVGSGH